MPAGHLVHPPGEARQRSDPFRAAALQVEADRPHPGPIESQDLRVGDGGRQLGDADEGGAEPPQGGQQVALVEGLEGAGDDRPGIEGKSLLADFVEDGKRVDSSWLISERVSQPGCQPRKMRP